MALPSSGKLSINDIRTYLGTTNGSLRALSAAAGFTTPDKISDFYGYSASSVIFTPNSGYSYPVTGAVYDTLGNINNQTGSNIELWLYFNPGATGLYCSSSNSMTDSTYPSSIYMTYQFVAANTYVYSATSYSVGSFTTHMTISIYKYSLQSPTATLGFAYSIGGGAKIII